MRMRTALLPAAALLLVVSIPGSAFAQQFTGGLRGACATPTVSFRECTVTLTNEGTAISRETVTNAARAVQLLGRDAGHLHAEGGAAGIQDLREQGHPDRDPDVHHPRYPARSRADRGVDHGDRAVAADRDVERLDRRVARPRGPREPAGPRPRGIPHRGHGADGHAVGDPQFNRQQDQTNASRISLGGGGVRANNYLVDGVPITDLTGRAVLNPTIEASTRSRCRCTPTTPIWARTGGGVFNTTAKSGTNQFHGTGFYQSRPVWGQSRKLLQRRCRSEQRADGSGQRQFHTYGGGVGGPIWRNRTFFWTATEGYRSTTTRNLQEIWPSAEATDRRFLHVDDWRAAGPDLQPVVPRRRRERQVSCDRDGIDRDGRRVHRRASSRAPTRRPIRSASTWSTRIRRRIPAAIPSAPTRTTRST